MPGDREGKQGRGRVQTAAGTTRTRARKKAKSTPEEEFSPERRLELARQIEAKRFRGKPPSI
jgi:hypothetical protein